MEVALGDIRGVDSINNVKSLGIGFGFVESVGVESLVCYDVILEKSFQVFLSVFTEEECVDSRAKLLECPVVRCKECSSRMRSFCDGIEETCFLESELES